jgi:hypothetical protein
MGFMSSPKKEMLQQQQQQQHSPTLGEYAKMGFGLGIGSLFITIILILVAAAIFIPGFIIVKKENKKEKDDKSKGMLILGYILMGLGMIIGIGFGAATFFDMLGDSI